MKIQLTTADFNPWQEVQNYQATHEIAKKFGATSVFVGTMRDFNGGNAVQSMFLEHYPGMTEHHLEKLSDAAHQRWSLLDTLIVHRVGDIYPGETIVLVAVWATHRAPALNACRYLIEALKQQAPFWKRETLAQGSRWVSHNTPGSIT
jgi:molybdopterin synthase catalytic subunit